MPNPHMIEPHKHEPKQHRDGKEPWCKECGLTQTYQEPRMGSHFPAAPATPMRDRAAERASQDLMAKFSYSSLPYRDAEIARGFCELAWKMHEELPEGFQKTSSLQCLLNAMQAALRAEANGQSTTSET